MRSSGLIVAVRGAFGDCAGKLPLGNGGCAVRLSANSGRSLQGESATTAKSNGNICCVG